MLTLTPSIPLSQEEKGRNVEDSFDMDKELIILEQIQNNPHVNQRDLATVTRAYLGMANAILKRFAEKGLIRPLLAIYCGQVKRAALRRPIPNKVL